MKTQMTDIELISKVNKKQNLAKVLTDLADNIHSNVYQAFIATFTVRKTLECYVKGIQIRQEFHHS